MFRYFTGKQDLKVKNPINNYMQR